MIDDLGEDDADTLVEPAPSTLTHPGGPMERRGRRSGQVSAKPCPACGAPVAIDPLRIVFVDQREIIPCAACAGRVPVRHSDRYRVTTAPVDIDDARWRRSLGFAPFRAAKNRAGSRRA